MFAIYHVDKHGRTLLKLCEDYKDADEYVHRVYADRWEQGKDKVIIVDQDNDVLREFEVKWGMALEAVPGKIWTFPSKSDPRKTYKTQINTNGVISCQCKGWTMKKKGKPRCCTHIEDVIAQQGLQVQENGQYLMVVDQKIAAAKKAFSHEARFQQLVAAYEAAINHMASLDPKDMMQAAPAVEQAKFAVESYMVLLETKGIDGTKAFKHAQDKLRKVLS